MTIPADFADECLFTQDVWYFHDVLEIDREAQRVEVLVDTTQLGLMVEAQRPFPGHGPHLPGAVVIQISAVLGSLLATYVLDMRATDGWVGFGTHIHKARFPSMGLIGPPVRASIQKLESKVWNGTHLIRYKFRYLQEDRLVYSAEHSAAWMQTEHRGPLR